jgi:hypothetical protein
MRDDMTPPGKELVRRLLTTVTYTKRLPAGRLRPPVGIIPCDLRSLGEVHRHLAPDDRSLPGVSLAALAGWVRDVLGDQELSDRIDSAVTAAPGHVAGCLAVYDLVGRRLAQASEAEEAA